PSALAAYTLVALFGAVPLNFDFATLSFQVPTTASAANAVAPRNSVLSRAIVIILRMVCLQWMFWSCLAANPARRVRTRSGEYARVVLRLQAVVRCAVQHGGTCAQAASDWHGQRSGAGKAHGGASS